MKEIKRDLYLNQLIERLVVVEFASFQDTIMFHKIGRFGLEKSTKF